MNSLTQSFTVGVKLQGSWKLLIIVYIQFEIILLVYRVCAGDDEVAL